MIPAAAPPTSTTAAARSAAWRNVSPMAGKRAPAPRAAAPAGVEQASLGEILESLGRDVIQVLSAPAGLDLPAGEPVIYDPDERSAIARGDIVLAVGIRAGS